MMHPAATPGSGLTRILRSFLRRAGRRRLGWHLHSRHRRAWLHARLGEMTADQYVFAMGAWSPRLSSELACPIPIEPGKGYSVTMPRPIPPEGRWTDRHRLVSFYASDELRAWIEEEMHRTGRSKTQVIVDALEAQHRSQRRRKTR